MYTRIRMAVTALASVVAVGAGTMIANPAMALDVCGTGYPPSSCSLPPYHPPQTTRLELVLENVRTFDWGNDHQTVWGDLYEVVQLSDGAKLAAYVEVTTTTWTDNWFTGFHATSSAELPSTGYVTVPQRYGVDGTVIGQSRRTDTWIENVSVAFAESNRNGSIAVHAVHS